MDKTKISTLIQSIIDSDKDQYDFTDIVDLDNALSRRLHLGAIDSDFADAVDNYIRFFNRLDDEEQVPIEKREPIKIYINSGGGDVLATLTIIDSIRNSNTPIITINTGMAYSGGFFIYIAGHKRLAYENSTFLFHEGSVGNYGDANKFNNWAEFYKKLLQKLKDITLRYTNITEEEYIAHQKDDWWFLAEDALQCGICDEIISVPV